MKQSSRQILILGIIGFFFGCGQASQTPQDKKAIHIGNLDSITVSSSHNNDTVHHSPIRLNELQIESFVKAWNNATRTGLCKYFPQYIVTVYLKDQGTRRFRTNSENIKEDSELCYQVDDAEFMDKILRAE